MHDILSFCNLNDNEYTALFDFYTNILQHAKIADIFSNRHFNPFDWQNSFYTDDEIINNPNYFKAIFKNICISTSHKIFFVFT